MNYLKWITDKLKIVDKNKQSVDFIPNKTQTDFVSKMSGKDIILKARQMGFSSIILAVFTADFTLIENTYNVVVADVDDNATGLLARVKYYVESYAEKTGRQIPLKYNSKTELYNPVMNSYYKIGSAKNIEFGRSKTISNLHLSELSFYSNPEAIFGSALQAVVPNGRVIIETTANGFNWFKNLWDRGEERGFKKHFYNPLWEYDEKFLEMKKRELERLFPQEYPMTEQEAFLTSGDLYFSKLALKYYLDNIKEPITENLIYGQTI